MPSAAGFTACQTSTYGWPTTSTCGSVTAATIRLSLEPGTRWSTSTPSRRAGLGPNARTAAGQVVDAVQRLDHDRLDPQVVAPDPLDQRGVVHALDPDPAAAGDPGAARSRPRSSRTRCGRAGAAAGAADRPGQRHRPAVEQEAGRAEREHPPPAVPVLQRDRVLGARPRPRRRSRCRPPRPRGRGSAGTLGHRLLPPPVAGQHVGAVVVAAHAATVRCPARPSGAPRRDAPPGRRSDLVGRSST